MSRLKTISHLENQKLEQRNAYVKPDPAAQVHRWLTLAWQPIEWIPKSVKWREWQRQQFFGYYFPNAEARMIDDTILRPRKQALTSTFISLGRVRALITYGFGNGFYQTTL